MRIVRKHAVKGLPKGYAVEYFGKVNETTYFIIACRGNSRHALDFTLVMGSLDTLFLVHINDITKYSDGALKSIETAQGNFWFPSRRMRNIQATFKGRYITIF